MADKNKPGSVMHILLTIKQNKFLLFLIIAIIGFAFYWYELRPTMVRNACADDAIKYASENTTDPDLTELSEEELKEIQIQAPSGFIRKYGLTSDMDPERKDRLWDEHIEDITETKLMLKRLSLKQRRDDVAETEYKRCMFRKGLEDRI